MDATIIFRERHEVGHDPNKLTFEEKSARMELEEASRK